MPHLNHRLGVSRIRDPLQHAKPNLQLMRALTRVRGRIVELEVLTQELGVLREQRAALQEVIGTPAVKYVRIAAAPSGGVEPHVKPRAAQWGAR